MKSSLEFEMRMNNGSAASTDLKKLSDTELVASAKNTAIHERQYMTGFLRHLIEIQVRGLYAANHPSLFQFVRETFGYDEASTQRRIDAANLLKEFPAIEPLLRSGALNLSNLAQARTFFRQEKKLGNDLLSARKLQVILGLSGKSVARDMTISFLSQRIPNRTPPRRKVTCVRSARAEPPFGTLPMRLCRRSSNASKTFSRTRCLTAISRR